MKQQAPSQQQQHKFPKYSDKFLELLNKVDVQKKQIDKQLQQQQYETCALVSYQQSQYNSSNIDHANQQQINNEYAFVTQLQRQRFFFRVKSIGVGAHSFVYLVQDQSTKFLYAQKAITRSHAQKHIHQLTNQIKIQYSLNHDNLIALYDFYSDMSYVYLIMEFAEESLFNLKGKFKIFKEKQVIEILRQLLHGVAFMHQKGFIHADIKIENVMIRNGRIKLCDFGYASKYDTPKQIDPDTIIGTLEYLSPEYVQGYDTGPLRDVWAIGILCFELWTGSNPFQGLKQNQKWMRLAKPDYNLFTDQLARIQHQDQRKSLRIQQIIKSTLCPYEKRITANELLKLDFFAIVN